MLILGGTRYFNHQREYKVFDTEDSTYLTITSKQLKQLCDDEVEIIVCPGRDLTGEIYYNLLIDIVGLDRAFKYPQQAPTSVGIGNTNVKRILLGTDSFNTKDYLYIFEYTYVRVTDPDDFLADSVFKYKGIDDMSSRKVTQLWHKGTLYHTHIGQLYFYYILNYKGNDYLLLYYGSSSDNGDVTHDTVSIFKKYCYYLINLDTKEEISIYDDIYPLAESWIDYLQKKDYRNESDFFMKTDNMYDCFESHTGYYFLGGNDDDSFEYINTKTGHRTKRQFISALYHKQFENIADIETAKVRNTWNVIAPKYLKGLIDKMNGIMSDLHIYNTNQITNPLNLLSMYLTWLCRKELEEIEKDLGVLNLHIELNYYAQEVQSKESSKLYWELFYLPPCHIGQNKYYPTKYFLASCGLFNNLKEI